MKRLPVIVRVIGCEATMGQRTKGLYDGVATAIMSGLDSIGLAWAGFLSAYVCNAGIKGDG